jgi:hypothetical protein
MYTFNRSHNQNPNYGKNGFIYPGQLVLKQQFSGSLLDKSGNRYLTGFNLYIKVETVENCTGIAVKPFKEMEPISLLTLVFSKHENQFSEKVIVVPDDLGFVVALNTCRMFEELLTKSSQTKQDLSLVYDYMELNTIDIKEVLCQTAKEKRVFQTKLAKIKQHRKGCESETEPGVSISSLLSSKGFKKDFNSNAKTKESNKETSGTVSLSQRINPDYDF